MRRAFSMVEVVLVVTIIGIVAAIAVPRVSDSSRKAAANALHASLANIRTAIDCYYAEHSKYPGYVAGTNTPDGVQFVDQLLRYTNSAGGAADSYGSGFVYGPYLRRPFPKNPTNGLATVFVKATPAEADPVSGSFGWVAVLSHGYFGVSATDAGLEKLGIIDIELRGLTRGLATQ
jgi:prepilin-type N-terminal cleavage/methylation domain-containing protein